MTEQEAKTKWCPFARVTCSERIDAVSWNRFTDDQDIPPRAYCIASACMAWRLEPHANNEAPRGYCGLAGRP